MKDTAKYIMLLGGLSVTLCTAGCLIRQSPEARQRAAESAWQIAASNNTDVAYCNFLRKYTGTTHTAEAEKRLTQQLERTATGATLKHMSADPNWSEKVARAIVDRTVFKGMVEHHVTLAWGTPDKIIDERSPTTDNLLWDYGDLLRVKFTYGEVDAILIGWRGMWVDSYSR